MALFNQFLQLPYAYIWLPGVVFFAVVGVVYWLTRSRTALAEATASEAHVTVPIETFKPKDQRGMHRRQGNPVEVHVGSPQDKANTKVGSVLDRSVGGLRLALFNPVPVGTVLSVKPTTADDMVPWVDLEVRSCQPSTEMPNQHEVGCQYVKSPPYSIQLLFG